jgi:5'-nucleotidase
MIWEQSRTTMPTILVTNDDGVYSAGLLALKQALSSVGDVVVLAPERNWSASSHTMTVHDPLRVSSVVLADGSAAYSTSGSPTDCVVLAAAGVVGVRPDLVVSGINLGYNLGIDVTYSGTVACAIEATIKGIPGIAVSSVERAEDGGALGDIQALAASVAREVAVQTLAHRLPRYTLLNVNVPGVASNQLKGVHITRMGNRTYPGDEVIERRDPVGRPYYWIGGAIPVDVHDDGSDVGAISNGYVSITPITLDMTDYRFIQELANWNLALRQETN